MNTRWIAIAEVAALLQMSRETIRLRLGRGEIPGLVEHFGTTRVERSKFDAWCTAQGKKKSDTIKRSPPTGKSAHIVYFVELDHGDRPIKIGSTTTWSLKTRLKKLRTASPYPLKLLGTVQGYMRDEKKLHRKFRKERLEGEWFHPSEELRKFLKTKGM